MAAMTETHSGRERGVRAGRWPLFAGVALAIVIADQVSKAFVDPRFGLAWTRAPVPGYDAPTPILGDLVRIAKSYNTGGIFGLFGQAAPLLALASLAVIGFIVYYQSRHGRTSRFLTLVLGLLLGGAVGNFIDRVRFGYVIDFVDMGIGDLRWYTFNVADAAISLSLVGLIAIALLGDRAARASSPRDAPDASDPDRLSEAAARAPDPAQGGAGR